MLKEIFRLKENVTKEKLESSEIKKTRKIVDMWANIKNSFLFQILQTIDDS